MRCCRIASLLIIKIFVYTAPITIDNMVENVPDVFKPRVLRNAVKYRFLRDHIFLPLELTWICEEMCLEHPSWAGQLTTPEDLASRYGLPEDGLMLWKCLYEGGELRIERQLCIAPLFDDVSLHRVTEACRSNFSDHRVQDICDEEAAKTIARRDMKVTMRSLSRKK